MKRSAKLCLAEPSTLANVAALRRMNPCPLGLIQPKEEV